MPVMRPLKVADMAMGERELRKRREMWGARGEEVDDEASGGSGHGNE